jgi:hypothetical protein
LLLREIMHLGHIISVRLFPRDLLKTDAFRLTDYPRKKSYVLWERIYNAKLLLNKSIEAAEIHFMLAEPRYHQLNKNLNEDLKNNYM